MHFSENSKNFSEGLASVSGSYYICGRDTAEKIDAVHSSGKCALLTSTKAIHEKKKKQNKTKSTRK